MRDDSTTTLAQLKQAIRHFVDERDWRQFHTPKDLAIGLSIESAEVLEHFRFRSLAETEALLKDPEKRRAIGHELADVLYFTLLMCEQFEMDASALLQEKMTISAARYPVEKARGRNDKYTEL